MRLAFFLATCALVVLISALSMYIFLNISKFRTDVMRLQAQRFEIVAGGLKDSVEKGLGLGLDLASLDNVPGLIRRLAAQHPEVLAIAVIDLRGQVLFGAIDLPGGAPPAEVLTRRLGRVEFGAARAILLPVDNSFNQRAGTVAVFYAADLARPIVERTLQAQLGTALWLLAAAAGLCLVGTLALVRRAVSPFGALGAALGGGDAAASATLDPALLAVVRQVADNADRLRAETDRLAERLREAA